MDTLNADPDATEDGAFSLKILTRHLLNTSIMGGILVVLPSSPLSSRSL